MTAPGQKRPFNYVVAAVDTEEGQRRLRAYYKSLGRFADMFARVETAMTLTLWHYAKVSPKTGCILFGGAKIDQWIKLIKQLAHAGNAPAEAERDLDYVMQQLGVINGARNDILHFGAKSVAEGNAVVSNALKAKGEPNEFFISPESLDR